MGFCMDLGQTVRVGEVGLFSFVFGVVQALAFFLVLWWLRRESRLALMGQESAAKSLVLPLYHWTLWLLALVTAGQAVANILLPLQVHIFLMPIDHRMAYSIVWGVVWGLYHFIIDGLCFFFMHHGAGLRAARRSAIGGGLWAILTTALHAVAFYYSSDRYRLSFIMLISWEGVLTLFYAALYLLPLRILFRRPATYCFAAFWVVYRLANASSLTLQYLGNEVGLCVYMFSSWSMFGIIKPFVIYQALLRDSQYWQGCFVYAQISDRQRRLAQDDKERRERGQHQQQDGKVGAEASGQHQLAEEEAEDGAEAEMRGKHGFRGRSPILGATALSKGELYREERTVSYDIVSPLLGQQVPAGSARSLALVMDRVVESVPTINFSCLSLGRSYTILGTGGTSRVYKGKYHGSPVAIKLIYCMELTPEVISNFYEEASMLARLQHPNVVKLLGVCVVPPALCMVMELCTGNLYELIHGDYSVRAWGEAVSGRLAQATAYYQASATLHQAGFAREPAEWTSSGGGGLILNWGAKLQMAIGAARGVAYLHQQNPPIIHKDIKSLNFLVTDNLEVKICDFEWSRPTLSQIISNSESRTDNDHEESGDRSRDGGRSENDDEDDGGAVVFVDLAMQSDQVQAPQAEAERTSSRVLDGARYRPIESPEAAGAGPSSSAASLCFGRRSPKGDGSASRGSARKRRKKGRQGLYAPDTMNWSAPEVVRGHSFSQKSDCYSLGVVLWEVFTGRIPFGEEQYRRGGQALVRQALVERNTHPSITPDIPPSLAAILTDMWHPHSSQRPTVQSVVDRLLVVQTQYHASDGRSLFQNPTFQVVDL